MTNQMLLAGFGGQGILFAGKFLAYQGLMNDKHVSWLPSYGPEMRGGTASCSVIVSDEDIGSPIVGKPDILVAMNLPSLDRYEAAVAPGGKIFYDSSLIGRAVKRTDVTAYPIPATKLANDNAMPTLANMIIMGELLAVIHDYHDEAIDKALKKIISARHQDMAQVNLKALEIGKNYQEA